MEFDRRNEKGPFDIIGDIHGCLEEFKELLGKLGYVQDKGTFRHPLGRKVIFLGDLGDRGPHCLKSIELAMQMVRQGRALYVPGNHCNKLNKYLQGRNVQITHGLEKTVGEWKDLPLAQRNRFAKEFQTFFNAASPYLILDEGRLVVTHAGIQSEMIGSLNKRIRDFCFYGDPTGEVTPEGLPVRRDWAKKYCGKALVVYGHTPVEKPEFRNHTIDIDTGCVTGGQLTALRYPERKLVQVQAKEVYYIRPEMKEKTPSLSL
ncbi:metallophosphoesterase [Desulforamulus ruminis]|uniref:Bis(5'-nucleosyl)-tetraphosphatase (Asymmetrical) n=1 Tax=Desulforamulus ruminis (strain ATCC 23193 / DSM 2154 / NCIMB 8452 / DL) TaxID=696281 RepID=F6DRT1_DESRL|nr:metallophosphoesterase [Desulforamulus ruminis]AEG59842.1 Bis(5'-nucleosyl)-tetraphosphatase (asymmetrical) [Desulforamulus ruminis DSM 2154]